MLLPFKVMRVTGRSMVPALHPGELVVVHVRAYAARSPQRGDIVAARPAAYDGRAVMKRVAGLPHDYVEQGGRQWRLGEGEYFLLGDAQEESTDSRAFGPVTAEELIGPVTWCVWPLRRSATWCRRNPAGQAR